MAYWVGCMSSMPSLFPKDNTSGLFHFFFEAYASFDAGILPVVRNDLVSVLPVKFDGFRLPFPGFQDALPVGQLSRPSFQFRQNLAGNAFSPAVGRCIHSFNFHAVRAIFFYSATAYWFTVFVRHHCVPDFINFIELAIK